jgi:hypothetical protein
VLLGDYTRGKIMLEAAARNGYPVAMMAENPDLAKLHLQ